MDENYWHDNRPPGEVQRKNRHELYMFKTGEMPR